MNTGPARTAHIHHPWGSASDETRKYPVISLETGVLKVYRPTAVELAQLVSRADELFEKTSSSDFWEVVPAASETLEDFESFAVWLVESSGYEDATDGKREFEWAADLLKSIVLWRTGMPDEKRGPTSRAKGLWGELRVLTQVEEAGIYENASFLWGNTYSKWDLRGRPGCTYPAEVKTTSRNEHRHALRHNQLQEGRAVGLRLLSLRCEETASTTEPTLEELISLRLQKAAAAGEEGRNCVKRCLLELRRLTTGDKGLRLRQEGVTFSMAVATLPEFPAVPAAYNNIVYEVTISDEGGILGLKA